MLPMAAIVGALTPAAALGSFPGGNGVIAYTAERSIWAVDPNTGNGLRLTSGSDDSAPSFSASGTMLTFQRWAGGTATVYLARADGSDAKPLVSGREPAFSPNGQQIVFVRAGGLFVTGLEQGSPVRQITDHPGDRAPRWSSTGSIVFERTDVWHVRRRGIVERQTRSELDVIIPPRSHVRRVLTFGGSTNMWPDWSPDGKTLTVSILFGCDLAVNGPPPMTHLLVTSAELTFHFSCYPSVWAPQGRGLAEAGFGALRGSPLTSCPAGPDYESEVSWQPLVAGTLLVRTVPCGGTPRPVPTTGTSPGKEETSPEEVSPGASPHRTRSCTIRHHKQHCKR